MGKERALVLPVRRMDGLQGIRAIAICGVFALHSGLGKGGYLGVNIFFVLSGFLITTLLVNEKDKMGTIDIRSFYVRRAGRLFPAAAVAIIVTTSLGVALAWGSRAATALGGITGIFYVSNWAAFATNHFLGASNFPWSLGQEEQFYLFAPLLIFRIRPVREVGSGWFLLGCAALCCAMRLMLLMLFPNWWISTYHNPLVNLDGMLAGSALALIFYAAEKPFLVFELLGSTGVTCLALIALAVCFMTVPLDARGLEVGPVLALLIAVILICNVTHRPGGIIDKVLSTAALTWVGDRSYGVYLVQIAVIYLWQEIHLGFYMTAILAFATSLAIAAFSYRYFESPIREVVHRRLLRPEASNADTAL